MKQLILSITREGQQHQLALDTAKSYTMGQSEKNSIVIPEAGDQIITISFDEATEAWHANEQKIAMEQELTISINEETIQLFLKETLPKQAYSLLGLNTWRIGQDEGTMITLANADGVDLFFEKQKIGWQMMILNAPIYVNHQLATGTVQLTSGDQLTIQHNVYTIYEDELHVAAQEDIVVQLPALAVSAYTFYEDYPDYHRSPRLIYRDPEEKVVLAAPDSAPNKNNQQLLKAILPPALMLVMTIVMNFIQPRGPYVIMTAATTVMTLIFSVTNYFKQNKKFKQDVIDRKHIYEEYLTEKSKEIYHLALEQRQGRLYHYPNIEELAELGAKFNHRIYEKTALHHDFLTYRLGLGEVDLSSEVSYSGSDGQKKLDEIEQEGMDLWLDSKKVSNVPITTDLISGPLGYIGPRKLVIEQLHLLVNQLSFFHSYHDLQFISIFPEDELPQWNWMRWLPHAKLQEMNVRGFVYHQRSRDQVLNSLTQILKNRKNALDEKGRGGENTIFTPHYVVMITDEKLILDHAIMEFFNEDPSNLGCSIIFVQDVMSSLPENIQTVIDVRDSKTGVMVLEKNELKNIRFELDHFPAGFNKEKLPRILAPLNHLQNLKNSIPEAITFLEMYEVDKFEDLNVMQRWAAHSPHKSLAVPLGVRGKEDIVYLNLHEKAHGPHGLVAGTTGSGKSEIVQSYILSLAVNFHPYEVAFLLIDYKGGGMANLFRNLPHLLGSITNLDGAQSMRALISINAELKRRQRLFSENNVNHINQYQKLYKEGDVTEPMPHLFLISDEFAELKSEQPEFMKELVSTARIGRSLGIHLILATQKPSGVVDDQIWSNSKFKLALKVADKSDSMEMLKTPDAAEITQPGRAYLQVGNNEIYELFQSAWSGADYLPDQSDQEEVDNTIYAINDLGQYEILSEDLSGLSDGKEVKTVPTELDAVIDGIHALTEEAGIAPLPRPWLPPLEERVYLPELDAVDYKVAWQEKVELEPMLGIADIPSMQAQESFRINLSKDGHIALYSSPGYGKSTFLQSVLMGLARQHNPERLHAYLLDFGTNGLLPLRGLPHVADTMNIDEEEKIGKFMRRMMTEMKRRKKLLSNFAVASLDMYEKASGEEEPRILIMVDGFEGFKNAKFESDLETVFNQVAREGAGIGMHLIVTAGRQASMRANLQSNIKVQIALKMIDDMEARSIVGRTTLTIEDMQGRGMIKFDEPTIFQAALPVIGEGTLDIIEGIQKEAAEMDEAWSGERPLPIPMIPEILNFNDFLEIPSVEKDTLQSDLIPFAVDFENVESVSWNIRKLNQLFVYSKSLEAETFIQHKAKQLRNKTGKMVLFDFANSNLIAIHDQFDAVATEKESYGQLLETLSERMQEREEKFETYKTENPNVLPIDFYKEMDPIFIVFHNLSKMIADMDRTSTDILLKLLEKGNAQGILSIITCDAFELNKGYDDINKLLKRSTEVLLQVKINDQSIFSVSNKTYKEENLNQGEAYYIKEGFAYKVKQPS